MPCPPAELPAVVATDLDGTLLRSDHTVSDRTRRTLDAVTAAGTRVVYVTGRPRRWLAPVVETTGHAGLAVIGNGAMVVDLDTDEVVHARPLAADLLRDVLARLRRALPGVALGVEWADGFAHEEAFARGSARAGAGAPAPTPATGDDALAAHPVLKLLARHPDGRPVGPDAAAALDGVAQVTWSTDDRLAEVSAPGVHKATTLAWLVERDGLSAADVVAFGDMPNDLELLAWAGWGVAVANAAPELRQVADELTTTNDHDGVATTLTRWL